MGFGVYGSEFRVSCSGSSVQGLGLLRGKKLLDVSRTGINSAMDSVDGLVSLHTASRVEGSGVLDSLYGESLSFKELS